MKQYSRFVGVDICKDRLDVHVHPDGQVLHLTNSRKAAMALVARFPGAAFACEASGGYERPFLLAAIDAGAPVWRLHPFDVRAFARLQGVRAKTDPIDARLIAQALSVAVQERAPTVMDDEAEDVRDLLTLRAHTVEEINAWKSRLTRLRSAAARIARARLASAERTRRRLEAEIDRALRDRPALIAKARRIISVPGAGPVLAAALIAFMPELGQLSSRQASSLIGVAPHPRQSGAHSRPGRCQAGRPQIRRILYMAALSALRADKAPFAPFYRRLRAAGKPHKVAIVAVMRKMIVAINSLIKQDRDWRPA